MPVTLGGGITIVYGSRSPPPPSERAASAAKHSPSSHAAYTSGSVVAGSYLSGRAVMGDGAGASAKRERLQIALAWFSRQRKLSEPHCCGSLVNRWKKMTARGDQCRRSSFALPRYRGPRRRVRIVRPLRVAVLRDPPSVRR